MNRLTFFALPLLLTLLAGCSSDAPTPAESSPPVATSAVPSPTATAPPVKPALADLVLSPRGVGPVVVGHPMPTSTPDVAVAIWDETYCDFEDDQGSDGQTGDHGGWKPAYEKTSEGKYVFAPSSQNSESPIINILVFTPEIRTVDGIGVGSTWAEIAASYPDVTVTNLESDDVVGYTLETDEGTLVLWEIQGSGSVDVAEVFAPSAPIGFSYEFGGCS